MYLVSCAYVWFWCVCLFDVLVVVIAGCGSALFGWGVVDFVGFGCFVGDKCWWLLGWRGWVLDLVCLW